MATANACEVAAGALAAPKEVRELARTYTEDAINRLVFWMKSDDPRASVAASNSLLDRGYGKPVAPIEAKAMGFDIVENFARFTLSTMIAPCHTLKSHVSSMIWSLTPARPQRTKRL